MEKRICDLFIGKKIVLKDIEVINDFKNLRKYNIFLSVDLKNFYNLIFVRDSTSRFLSKDAIKLLEICKIIEDKKDIKIKKRTLFYRSSFCNKAKLMLENWKLYAFM